MSRNSIASSSEPVIPFAPGMMGERESQDDEKRDAGSCFCYLFIVFYLVIGSWSLVIIFTAGSETVFRLKT